jgi:hypothetical protein
MNNLDPYKILYPPPHLCECNECGLITKPKNRFISGHNTRVNNPMDNEESRKKIGVTNRLKGTYEKTVKILIENNPMNNPLCIQKRKENFINKYGVDNPQKVPEIVEKRVATFRRFGYYEKFVEYLKTDNPSKRPEVRQKLSDANTDWEFYYEYGVKKSWLPYNGVFTREFKNKIRSRDCFRCVITGITNEEHRELYGCDLLVHHWNYNKDETDPYYFVTVCRPINAMAEFDKDCWMSLFGGIAEEGTPLWKMYERNEL